MVGSLAFGESQGEKGGALGQSFKGTGPPAPAGLLVRVPHGRVSVADSTISMYLLRNVPMLAGLPDALLEGLVAQLSGCT